MQDLRQDYSSWRAAQWSLEVGRDGIRPVAEAFPNNDMRDGGAQPWAVRHGEVKLFLRDLVAGGVENGDACHEVAVLVLLEMLQQLAALGANHQLGTDAFSLRVNSAGIVPFLLRVGETRRGRSSNSVWIAFLAYGQLAPGGDAVLVRQTRLARAVAGLRDTGHN